MLFSNSCISKSFLLNKNQKNDKIIYSGKILINGIEQYILVRGDDINNPLLLYLHGGPGATDIPFYIKHNTMFEKYYTVVHWEQRGTEKSYYKNIPLETMNINQFVDDTIEVINWLKNRLNKKKILLVGNSWGGGLGILVAKKSPDLLYAYIAISPLLNPQKTMELSYKYTLEKAIETNNKKAIKDLQNKKPPYNLSKKEGYNNFKSQKNWVAYFGGFCRKYKDMMFYTKYFSLSDVKLLVKTMEYSHSSLNNDLQKMKLDEDIKEIKIPIYVFLGKYDYNVPFSIAEDFYNNLNAPKKELIWFEESAHLIIIEEPNKYQDILINKILPDLLQNINNSGCPITIKK